MRRFRWVIVAGLLLAFAAPLFPRSPKASKSTDPTRSAKEPAAAEDRIGIYFSPNGGATEAVVRELSNAKKTIHLQAYSFTSAPIAKALVDAKKRGVEVTAILDKSQRTEKYSSATFLHNEGVPAFIDAQHAIAHNKVILIDGTTIITGSFNFTKAAEENNAENLLIIKDKPDLYAAYERNWQQHREHSEKYEGLPKEGETPTRGPSTTGPADEAQPNEVAEEAQGQSDPKAITVYATKKRATKYHRLSCSSLRNSRIAMSLYEAKAKGLLPCFVCKPEE